MRTTKSAVAGLLVGAMAVAVPATLPGSFAEPAAAEVVVGDTPEPSWRVNGRVYAVKVVGHTVFVGGDFDHASVPAERPRRSNARTSRRSTSAPVRGRGLAGRRRRPRPRAGCAEGLSLRRRQLRRGRGQASVETREGERRHRSREQLFLPPPLPRGPRRRGAGPRGLRRGSFTRSAVATVDTWSSWARPRGGSTAASSPTRTSPCLPWSVTRSRALSTSPACSTLCTAHADSASRRSTPAPGGPGAWCSRTRRVRRWGWP